MEKENILLGGLTRGKDSLSTPRETRNASPRLETDHFRFMTDLRFNKTKDLNALYRRERSKGIGTTLGSRRSGDGASSPVDRIGLADYGYRFHSRNLLGLR